MTRMTDYQTLCEKLSALMEGVPHRVANLANASALLYAELEDLNWAGFYFLEGGKLVLGPFQGKPACIEIEVGKGVCGMAVQEERIQLVPDVPLFPGHIACDSASASELVIPIRSGGRIVGVLDIDSPIKGRFDERDAEGLALLAGVIGEKGDFSRLRGREEIVGADPGRNR